MVILNKYSAARDFEILGNVAGRWILCEAGDMVILNKDSAARGFLEICWNDAGR